MTTPDTTNKRHARQWDRLESLGLVRITFKPDDDADLSFLDQEEWADVRADEYARADRDGCWGVVGEYRLADGVGWKPGDSVWGFIGDDAKHSDYLPDIQAATLARWREVVRARCRCCKGSGARHDVGGVKLDGVTVRQPGSRRGDSPM